MIISNLAATEPGNLSTFAQRHNRFASHYEPIFTFPRHNFQHGFEWIEPDALDTEVTKLVTGSSASSSPRRCCQRSTSSGYSSQYSPLPAAASYSCYVNAKQARAAASQMSPGLAVIHESEANLPRPIWPFEIDPHLEALEHDGIYTYCGCCCSYPCPWDKPASAACARDILLELSQTLSSVIDGESNLSPEEVLQNISQKVAQGINLTKANIYEECLYHSSSTSSGENSTSIKVNPVNLKLYRRPIYAAPTTRCNCEVKQSSVSPQQLTSKTIIGDDKKRPDCSPTVFLVPDFPSCRESKSHHQQQCTGHHQRKSTNDNQVAARNNYYRYTRCGRGDSQPDAAANGKCAFPSEPEYSTLKGSDGSSSTFETAVNSNWERYVKGFGRDLDFTLDISSAEKLGKAIAKAKRQRQWCRGLIILLGLVFFILSVIVVSLTATRGKKLFGSM